MISDIWNSIKTSNSRNSSLKSNSKDDKNDLEEYSLNKKDIKLGLKEMWELEEKRKLSLEE